MGHLVVTHDSGLHREWIMNIIYFLFALCWSLTITRLRAVDCVGWLVEGDNLQQRRNSFPQRVESHPLLMSHRFGRHHWNTTRSPSVPILRIVRHCCYSWVDRLWLSSRQPLMYHWGRYSALSRCPWPSFASSCCTVQTCRVQTNYADMRLEPPCSAAESPTNLVVSGNFYTCFVWRIWAIFLSRTCPDYELERNNHRGAMKQCSWNLACQPHPTTRAVSMGKRYYD